MAYMEGDDDYTRGVGPLLVKQMAEEHVLDANLFSLYLMNENNAGLGP